MFIGRGDGDCMNQPTTCIYTDMTLHSKTPFVSLHGLVHFRITGFVCIFGRAGRIDNGSVYDCHLSSCARL